jgi:nitrogen fixation/metabolism regulation signal transduction histidine kinase
MNKLTFKQKVLEAIRAQVEQELKDLYTEINRIQEGEMDKEEDQFDMDEGSQDEAAHELLDRLSEQRNFSLAKQEILESMDKPEALLEEVAPGAVVVTNQGTFYISVSTDDFQVDGKQVRGISKEAPIYEVIKEKKKGNAFSFRDVGYEIKDVY